MGSASELRITFSIGPIALAYTTCSLLCSTEARLASHGGSRMDILEIMYGHKAIGLLRCRGEGAVLTKGC